MQLKYACGRNFNVILKILNHSVATCGHRNSGHCISLYSVSTACELGDLAVYKCPMWLVGLQCDCRIQITCCLQMEFVRLYFWYGKSSTRCMQFSSDSCENTVAESLTTKMNNDELVFFVSQSNEKKRKTGSESFHTKQEREKKTSPTLDMIWCIHAVVKYRFLPLCSTRRSFRSRMPKSGGQELWRVSGSGATLCLVCWGGEWSQKCSLPYSSRESL